MARALGVKLEIVAVKDPCELADAVDRMASLGVAGLVKVIIADPVAKTTEGSHEVFQPATTGFKESTKRRSCMPGSLMASCAANQSRTIWHILAAPARRSREGAGARAPRLRATVPGYPRVRRHAQVGHEIDIGDPLRRGHAPMA